MDRKPIDILVIGAGITGLSTAYFLTKNGHNVHVYDRIEKLGSQLQASSVNCGILCCPAHTSCPLQQTLFGESLNIAKEMGEDAKFVKQGSVELLKTDTECEWGRTTVKRQMKNGFNKDQIAYIEQQELPSIERNIGPDVLGAVADEGHVNPRRMTKSMGIMAKGAGAKIHLNSNIVGIKYVDQRYHVDVDVNNNPLLTDEFITAKTIVFASGATTQFLLKPLKVDIPIIPVRGTMWATKPIEKTVLDSTILAGESHEYWSSSDSKLNVTHLSMDSSNQLTRHIYGKQTHDRRIIFGGDRRVETLDAVMNSPIVQESIDTNKAHVTEYYPWLADHSVEKSWTGIMPFTPDGVPVIGKINALPGSAFIISGMASAGMMQGPGAGKLLADLMNGSPKAKLLLKSADPDRFMNSNLIKSIEII